MQNFRKRISVQKYAQNAGSNVLKEARAGCLKHRPRVFFFKFLHEY